jgi:molybdenum cofactor cytidylyltransferase
VLLAAGESRRMEKNKLLLPYGNHTVIEESLYQLSGSNIDEIAVITGFQHDIVRDKIIDRSKNNIKIVFNEDYRSGRSSSIKCAISNLEERSDAVLFMVADKPSVKTDLINRAITEFQRKSPSILYVRTPNGRGHPVIFSSRIFGELLELEGEPAGDAIFEKYRDSAIVIGDDNEQIDIDTPEDYRRVIEMAGI